MKHWLLQKICEEINANKTIFSLHRIGDNIFWILFDKSGGFLFDMENKSIFLSNNKPTSKNYSAPIDVWLAKNCFKAQILNANVKDFDKILEIDISSQNSYKVENYTLRFEFIPPKGAFIVAKDKTVICALRYDDRVQIKKPLIEPTPPPRPPDAMPEWAQNKNISEILALMNEKAQSSRLGALKIKKLEYLTQKITKLETQILSLESADTLNEKANEAFQIAQTISSNMHMLNIGDNFLTINESKIELGFEKSIGDWKDFYYLKSKKLKQKAMGVYARYENLKQKAYFWDCLRELITLAQSESDIATLDPPKRLKSSKKDDDWHEIYFDDAKIMIGKSAVGNEKLLKLAKAGDLWFHLQGIPGAHVIVKGKNFKNGVIEKAAELCAKFSGVSKGSCLVDYTNRKNVSPVGGANVKYIEYKTIQVTV